MKLEMRAQSMERKEDELGIESMVENNEWFPVHMRLRKEISPSHYSFYSLKTWNAKSKPTYYKVMLLEMCFPLRN